MTSKRCRRRPVLVRSVPIGFGFPSSAKLDATLQARSALDAVLSHKATPIDVNTLIRVALYCNSMCEQMLRADTIEVDGLADIVDAVTSGLSAIQAVSDRFKRSGLIGTAGPDRQPLVLLVDAYEAIFKTATRRESIAALEAIDGVQ